MSAPAPAAVRVLAQARFESIAALRHGEQLLLSIVLPVLLYFGLAHPEIAATFGVIDAPGSANAANAALPGVLAVCVVSSAFTGQAISTGFDRRYGVLRHLATTPLGRSGLMLGKAGAVLVVIAVQLIVIAGCGAVLGASLPATAVLPLIVSILLGVASFLSLGLLIAGTLRAEATLAGANLLWVAFVAAGGLLTRPEGLWGTVTDFLPTGALRGAMSEAILHGGVDAGAWLVLLLWSIVAGAACARLFKWS